MLSQKLVRSVALWGLVQMGCGSTPVTASAPDVSTTADAARDATIATDAVSEAVWSSAIVSFSLRVSGGFPTPPIMPGCDGNDHTYTYDVARGALRHVGCEGRQRVNSAVTLDDATRTALAAEMSALRTTATLGCGADFNDLALTVTRGAGAAQTYNSTFFAGCPGTTLTAPFIAGDALNRIAAWLRYAINTCVDGDAGLRCTALDAGAPDGG